MRRALGAQRLHRLDRRLQHARQRAAPAGMRRADHAGRGSASSTGWQSAVSTVSASPGVAVTIASARGFSARRAGHRHHIGRMHLMHRHQPVRATPIASATRARLMLTASV
jgi:hypothetical protein